MCPSVRRFVALLPLALVLLLVGPSPGLAQAPPAAHPITTCVDGRTGGYLTDPNLRTGDVAPDPSALPEVDGAAQPNWAMATRRLMSTFVECSLDYAAADIVPLVLPWFNGILLIMVVWTGITVMYSGSGAVQTLLPFIMMAVFASALMNTYYTTSGDWFLFAALDGRGLVHTILAGAEQVSETLFDQADEVYYVKFDEAREEIAERDALLIAASGTSLAGIATRIGQATATGGIAGLPAGPLGAFVGALVGGVGMAGVEFVFGRDALAITLWTLVVMGIMYLFLGILHIAYWIIMAQYMWGYFSMAVIAVVGPFFIPLVLIPQTQDYFWGWFKALVNSAFYMITAAALYVIIAVALTFPLDFLVGPAATSPTDYRTAFAGIMEFATNLFMQYLPVIAMALLAAIQVGSVANGMTSGSPPPGAGLAGRIRQLGAGGATVAGARAYARDRYQQWQAHRAGVLSGDTRRRRQAVDQAHQAFGGGPASQSGSGPVLNVHPTSGGGGVGEPSSGPGPGPRSGGVGGPSVLKTPEFQLFERRMTAARQPAQMAKALDEYKRAILRRQGGSA